MYTFSFIVGNIIPKSVKCIHSATKLTGSNHYSDSILNMQGGLRVVKLRLETVAPRRRTGGLLVWGLGCRVYSVGIRAKIPAKV